ncbi:hypothetical protein DFP72DRAFT_913369 [Ephemerocybe angulata]|uniref:AP complex mu/sigma subunit domain-containing protein n=1 Tax=Ephemerocybe angulata TaxID=980116 RepID=A0A8H6HLU1_9AGAR|nr:hypothetical protein DFP72DRAFT_913369 [Tulosesus angulatus]
MPLDNYQVIYHDPQLDDGKGTSTNPSIVEGRIAGPCILSGAQNVHVESISTTTVGGNYNVTIVNHHYHINCSSDGQDVSVDELIRWLKGPDFFRLQREALNQRVSEPVDHTLTDPPPKTIKFFMIWNRQGRTRLSKWFDRYDDEEKALLRNQVHSQVALQDKAYKANSIESRNCKVVYVRKGGLCFCACVSTSANELRY